MIYIIGIGPGNDINYLTLKAYKTIKNVDLGIYIGEMIGEDIKSLFDKNKLIFGRNLEKAKIKLLISDAIKNEKVVALLLPGSAAIYSGQYNEQFTMAEYVCWFNECNLKFEVIPGLSSMDILCAKTTIDLTAFTNTQNVFITSIERLKELNQLDKASLSKILSAKPNIILYQSYREWQYIKGIIENCYELNTKVIFGYKLSWQDEIIIETTLENADNAIKGKDLNKHTIILIMPNI